MRFREIQPDDIAALFEVRIATWHNDRGAEELTALGITRDSVKTMMQSTHRGWLCEIEDRVVGFSMGSRETGEMWVIAVLKEYEGQGIGKKLLTLVEEWLWSEGWHEIWLTTDPDETFRAVGFYRHQGWEDWKLDGNRFMRKRRPETATDSNADQRQRRRATHMNVKLRVLLAAGITAVLCCFFATLSGDPITMLFTGAVGGVISFLLLLLVFTRPRVRSFTPILQILVSGAVGLLTTLTLYMLLHVAVR